MSDKPFDYWTFFAEDARRTGSEFYARLAEGIGTNEELKALAAKAKPGQPHANMLLGSVHYLLLRGADHPLRRFYSKLHNGPRPEGEDPFPLFQDFVARHRAELETLIATRVTNTNEVGRTALLHPGFRMAARQSGEPLHLIEIGPSAGLNMIWDRYGVRYRKNGETFIEIAPDAPLVIECELRGDKLPPAGPTPKIASRVGLELSPVDLSKSEDRDWLRALMWPDQIARGERLDRAIALFQKEKPPIVSGDALALLPDALRRVPEDQPVCVYHTIVVYQFSREMREALANILTLAGLRRPLWELAFDFDGKDYPLSLTRYHDGVRDKQRLANSHPHGTWLEWLV